MNNAQHPANDGVAHIEPIRLQRWVHRLNDAIHTMGRHPMGNEVIEEPESAWADLHNAIRELALITPDNYKARTLEAMQLLARHRVKMYMELIKVGDILSHWADRVMLRTDLDLAKEMVNDAASRVMRAILGLR